MTIALFYVEENWRGKRAWENCKRQLEAKGLVLNWSARANDSYDIGANPYTTIVAGGDADRKAALSISEQIQTQLALYMRRRART